jgi:hypothetical protein
MKEERLICPTTPKLSDMTERWLEAKLQIYNAPRNGTYILLAAVACQTTLSTLCIQVTSFSSIIIVLKLNLSPSILSPGESST